MEKLLEAAKEGNLADAKDALEAGTDVDAKNNIFDQETALHLSATKGHEAIAKLLIESGADVNAKDKDGSTPLYKAARGGHAAIAKLLLEAGSEPSAKRNGETPLHTATVNGHEAIVKLLVEAGVDVNAKNLKGHSPLHWAAVFGHEPIVKLLLKAGADADAKNKDEETPLHLAAMKGHEGIVKLLIGNGADVNAKDKDGSSPLYKATRNVHETIAKMLVEAGAAVNAKDKDGETLLHFASRFGYSSFAKLLVEAGADVTIQDNNSGTFSAGKTALYYATDPETKKFLKFCTEGDVGRSLHAMGLLKHAPKFYTYDNSLTLKDCKSITEDDLKNFVGIMDKKDRVVICNKWKLQRNNRSSLPQRISKRLSGMIGNAKTAASYDVFLTHDWSTDGNHARVSKLNQILKSKGLNTWFDEDRMQGNIPKQMASGIEKSKLVIVFITKKYMEKLNSDGTDNCKEEFLHAARKLGTEKMIAVVMESEMKNPKDWFGPLALKLGDHLFHDFSDDGNPPIDALMKEIKGKL